MKKDHPNFARSAGLIAVMILATLLSALALTAFNIMTMAPPAAINPPTAIVWHFDHLGPGTLQLIVSTFVASLLLLRFARLRKYWHGAALAVTAQVMGSLFWRSKGMQWLLQRMIVPLALIPQNQQFPWKVYGLFAVVHAVQIAIAILGYRLISLRLARDHPTAETASPAPQTSEPHGSRPETSSEWKVFSIFLTCIVLLVAGEFLAIRELQLRQIPTPVWSLLQKAPSVEVVTFGQIPAGSVTSETIWNYPIASQFSAVTPQERSAVIACLRRSMTGWSSVKFHSSITNPTHAIRVTDERKTYLLLLSFKDRKLVIYEGDKGLITIDLLRAVEEFEALAGSGTIPSQ